MCTLANLNSDALLPNEYLSQERLSLCRLVILAKPCLACAANEVHTSSLGMLLCVHLSKGAANVNHMLSY